MKQEIQELHRPRRHLQRMILRNTAALPAIVTLLNGLSGFVSVHYAMRGGVGRAAVSDLQIAAWLIFLAMVFDALDGRLARITRHASDFGAQLDSLCDVISFGVAPAFLMLQAVAMTRQIPDFDFFLPQASTLGKLVMAIAVIYVCCAVLRLARFNIEHAPDMLRHLSFNGLPSPAAAAVVASLVLLLGHIQTNVLNGKPTVAWLNITVGVALPTVTLLVALLMVSRLRYPHLMNQFVVGKRPFGAIVKGIVLIVLGCIFREYALALATLLFAAAGPLWYLRKRPHIEHAKGLD